MSVSSGTGSPGKSRTKGRKTVVVVIVVVVVCLPFLDHSFSVFLGSYSLNVSTALQNTKLMMLFRCRLPRLRFVYGRPM